MCVEVKSGLIRFLVDGKIIVIILIHKLELPGYNAKGWIISLIISKEGQNISCDQKIVETPLLKLWPLSQKHGKEKKNGRNVETLKTIGKFESGLKWDRGQTNRADKQ